MHACNNIQYLNDLGYVYPVPPCRLYVITYCSRKVKFIELCFMFTKQFYTMCVCMCIMYTYMCWYPDVYCCICMYGAYACMVYIYNIEMKREIQTNQHLSNDLPRWILKNLGFYFLHVCVLICNSEREFHMCVCCNLYTLSECIAPFQQYFDRGLKCHVYILGSDVVMS